MSYPDGGLLEEPGNFSVLDNSHHLATSLVSRYQLGTRYTAMESLQKKHSDESCITLDLEYHW